MQEKKFVGSFRRAKIIQLGLLLITEAVFILVLLLHPSMSRQIYSDGTLFFLCAAIWFLSAFSLAYLIYDFVKLRSFARESHTLKQEAYLDALTGLPNRHGLDMILQSYSSPDAIKELGCCMLMIDNLTAINDSLGHPAGDRLIRDFCVILERVGDDFGSVGRNAGNEFLAVLDHCSDDTAKRFQDRLNAELSAYNRAHPMAPIQLHSALVLNGEAHFDTLPQLLIAAYNKLHAR
jgi:diguanylate cyclase (GGDEF)-like protein